MRENAQPPPASECGSGLAGLSGDVARVIDAATTEIYLFDASTLAISSMSHGARTNLGYSPNEYLAMTPLDLMPSLGESELELMLGRLRDGDEDQIRFEEFHQRKSGSTYIVEVSLQLIAVQAHQFFFAEVRDVTETRAIDHQLRQAQKVDAVAQLTSGVAHDFNNLLFVVKANLHVLLADPALLGVRERRLVQGASDAASRGTELTHGLMALARQEPLGPKRVDVSRLVLRTIELLRRSVDDSIKIDTVPDDDLWPTYVDIAQLESALINLVVNARDAMPGGGRITITTKNVEIDEDRTDMDPTLRAGSYVKLAVSDSGRGMTAAVRSHAFEPFFTTKPVGKGTGLGLAMVRGFCQQSGGQATISSSEEDGTTVTMYLPRLSL